MDGLQPLELHKREYNIMKPSKHLFIASLLALVCTLALSLPAAAQTSAQLTLRLSRDFGYSSGGGQIQGKFSLRADSPEDLVRVDFIIDGQVIAEDREAPFRYQFDTSQFPTGIHTFSAEGYTQGGAMLASNEIRAEFVTATEGWQSALRIIIPILGIALVAILFSFVVPLLLDRGKSQSTPLGKPRSYGMLGGTICPKCDRPFALHMYGMNLLVGKLDRCPHCRKWSLVRRAPIDILRAAEIAEMAGDQVEKPRADDERALERELEDSRYLDI